MVRKARSWEQIVKQEGAVGVVMGEDIGPELAWKKKILQGKIKIKWR